MGRSAQYSGPISSGTASVTSAQTLVSTSTPCRGVHLNAATGNSTILLVGDSASQTFELDPGDFMFIVVDNVQKINVLAASGTTVVNWIAEL